MHNAVCHRSEDDACDAPDTPRSHDDCIAVLLDSAPGDLMGGVADAYMTGARNSRLPRSGYCGLNDAVTSMTQFLFDEVRRQELAGPGVDRQWLDV
jgi:hypothetical protein